MRIMISCGEPSGDLYAGALVQALTQLDPSAEVFGFGGPKLEAAGAELVGRFDGLSVAGLAEVVGKLPRLYAMLRRVQRALRDRRPDVLVAVDFFGFNSRLIASAKRLGVPVVYYVSPQLWAWRPRRMETMRRFVDLALVIFPFEVPLYRRAGVPVRFVGHPLAELARTTRSRQVFLHEAQLQAGPPIVALLPGSRPGELARIVPGLARTLPLIRAEVPGVQFVIAAAAGLPDRLFRPLQTAVDPPPPIVRNRTDDALAVARVVITASGTATVQAAMHKRPMVVVYRVSTLSYHLGRRFLMVDTFAMVNLVAGRRIVPELIQDRFIPARVAEETVSLLLDEGRYEMTRENLGNVRRALGEPGASMRAAQAVLGVARGEPVVSEPESARALPGDTAQGG
jgi:lipid-A-disaccharide synthase